MSVIENLEWRAAIKSFDPTKKLSADQLDQLLSAVRLAPSSAGMQHYKIVVVEDPAIREKLREAANGQAQLTEASQVVVFAAETNIDEQYVKDYIDLIASTRGVDREQLAGFEQNILKNVNGLNHDQKITWASKQAYIALGVLLTAAAEMHIDACPMEGFAAAKFDEILGLKELGLTTAVIAPIGFRSDNDVYSKMAKVRKSKANLFIHI
jgi:nitroreductase/dihydropteridine reductase